MNIKKLGMRVISIALTLCTLLTYVEISATKCFASGDDEECGVIPNGVYEITSPKLCHNKYSVLDASTINMKIGMGLCSFLRSGYAIKAPHSLVQVLYRTCLINGVLLK